MLIDCDSSHRQVWGAEFAEQVFLLLIFSAVVSPYTNRKKKKQNQNWKIRENTPKKGGSIPWESPVLVGFCPTTGCFTIHFIFFTTALKV